MQPCNRNGGHEAPPDTSSRCWRAKPPAPWRKSPQVLPQHLPSALLATSGCKSKGGCGEGHGAGGASLHRPPRQPASVAERDFPAQADTLSPLSNCSLCTGLACPRAGAGSFPSIALSLPTARLPWGSQLLPSGSQPGSASPALSHPSHLSVVSSPFPLLLIQVCLPLAPTLVSSLAPSFAQKSKKQWGLYRGGAKGGGAGGRCEGGLPTPEACLNPLHLVICAAGPPRS